MKFFSNMGDYYDHLVSNNRELAEMLNASDPVAAFDLFVRRNVDLARQAQFADGSNREAEIVRQAIRGSARPHAARPIRPAVHESTSDQPARRG